MIHPATQLSPVMDYLATHWTPGHPIGRSITFASFMFCTPWVDKKVFGPQGISVLWHGDDGLSCALVTPDAAWHVYWHVRTPGKGIGRALLDAMVQHVAPKPLYVLGISALGRPHYEKAGFEMGTALRYALVREPHTGWAYLKTDPLDPAWVDYRYVHHPLLQYQVRGETIVREDVTEWGSVLHVAHLGTDWPDALFDAQQRYDLVQAWTYRVPGDGWKMPPATVPTVFHPVEARGNALLVAGMPHLPPEIHGSDGGQDRSA